MIHYTRYGHMKFGSLVARVVIILLPSLNVEYQCTYFVQCQSWRPLKVTPSTEYPDRALWCPVTSLSRCRVLARGKFQFISRLVGEQENRKHATACQLQFRGPHPPSPAGRNSAEVTYDSVIALLVF